MPASRKRLEASTRGEELLLERHLWSWLDRVLREQARPATLAGVRERRQSFDVHWRNHLASRPGQWHPIKLAPVDVRERIPLILVRASRWTGPLGCSHVHNPKAQLLPCGY